MTTTTYASARQNFKTLCDQACNDSETIIIKRRNGEDVVLISLRDYESLDETAYLLRSPANAKMLEESIAQVAAGNVIEFDPTLD